MVPLLERPLFLWYLARALLRNHVWPLLVEINTITLSSLPITAEVVPLAANKAMSNLTR